MASTVETKLSRLDHWDWISGGLVFALMMLLYVRTLAPGLLLGDSAEFQALAYTLGLAHSTGYPVYILLAKLATFLPVGDVAYRVNLFSAMMGALALAQMVWIGRLLGGGRIASLLAPLAVGVSPIYWWQTVIAEVYTPAAAFMAGVVLMVLLWRCSGNGWHLFAAGVLGGLSLGVHNTVSLAAPGVVVYLLVRRCNRQDWLKAVTGALVGLALYLAAFFGLDALSAPGSFTEVVRPNADVWGYTLDDFASPLKRFEFLAFAVQWRGQMFSMDTQSVFNASGAYFDRLRDGFPWAVRLLATLGTLALFVYPQRDGQRSWREGLFIGVTWATLFFYLINYNIGDIDTFYIPGYILLFSTAGAGIMSIIDLVMRLIKARNSGHLGSFAVGLVSLLIVGLALLPARERVVAAWEARQITFLNGTGKEWYPYPLSQPEAPAWYARQVVQRLEPNAIVFTTWDHLYGVLYVASVERDRDDVQIHELYPFGSEGKVSPQMSAYIAEQIKKRPIYLTWDDEYLRSHYRLKVVDFSIPVFQLVER